MKLITAFGPSVFSDQAEMATMLVPHQHLSSRGMRNQTAKLAMSSTSQGVLDLSADSHINVASASDMVTTSESAINSSLQEHPHWHQLQESTFRPVTPVQVDRLEHLLQGHLNSKLVQKVINGFQFGFSLKYTGPRGNRQPCNLPTAFTHSQELWKSVVKEVSLGYMLGPFDVQAIFPLICLPVSMVQKKNSTAMRHTTHWSHPQGSSINSFIAPEDAETHYQTFEAAVQLVARHGKGAYMAKEMSNQFFLGMSYKVSRSESAGYKGARKVLHRLCAACVIFEDIFTLIHWITERRAGQKFIHYLDDFFMVHRYRFVARPSVYLNKCAKKYRCLLLQRNLKAQPQ